MGRIRHLLGIAGDRAAGSDGGDREPVAGDPAFAEFCVSGGSNLDMRPRVSRVIDYPFTGGDGAEPGIPPTDLLVEYDGDRELLVLRGPDGSTIRPLHLGLTSEVFLPPAQSLLVRGFGANPTVMMPDRDDARLGVARRAAAPTGLERGVRAPAHHRRRGAGAGALADARGRVPGPRQGGGRGAT